MPWTYADILLRAESLRQAEDLAIDEVSRQVHDDGDVERETSLVFADRLSEHELDQLLAELKIERADPSAASGPVVYAFRWLP